MKVGSIKMEDTLRAKCEVRGQRQRIWKIIGPRGRAELSRARGRNKKSKYTGGQGKQKDIQREK